MAFCLSCIDYSTDTSFFVSCISFSCDFEYFNSCGGSVWVFYYLIFVPILQLLYGVLEQERLLHHGEAILVSFRLLCLGKFYLLLTFWVFIYLHNVCSSLNLLKSTVRFKLFPGVIGLSCVIA